MTDPSVPLSEPLTAAELDEIDLLGWVENGAETRRLVAMARRSLEPRVRIRPLPPLIIPEEAPNAS